MRRRFWRKKPGRHGRRRRVLCVVLLIVGLVVGWYVVGRLMGEGRALRVVDRGAVAEAVLADRVGRGNDFRIVTYNIAHGRGTGESNWSDSVSRGKRLRAIGAWLREVDADVVVLNEVDFSSVWSGHENQAALLAEAAGYRYRVELTNIDVSVPFANLRFGNAVLSRMPITKAEVIELPGYAWWETMMGGKKLAVLCQVELGEGMRVGVVGAHFDTRGDEGIRIASAREVNTAVKGWGLPTVVAGDLNSTPAGLPGARVGADGRSGVDVLVEEGGFTRVVVGDDSGEATPTFPSWGADRAIDWVLVGEGCELIGLEVVESLLSDHLPVIAGVGLVSQE